MLEYCSGLQPAAVAVADEGGLTWMWVKSSSGANSDAVVALADDYAEDID